jgi:hypothetical protein
MTALQTIIKEAKVIWKKHPKLSWQEAIKKASTMYKSKHKPKKSGKSIAGKRIVKKSAPKKSAPKKVATKKTTHKDTKSHNVNIRVVSGVDATNMSLRQIKINNESIDRLSKLLVKNKESVKYHPYNTTHYKNYFKQKNKEITNYVKMLKVQNTQLKKHIK